MITRASKEEQQNFPNLSPQSTEHEGSHTSACLKVASSQEVPSKAEPALEPNLQATLETEKAWEDGELHGYGLLVYQGGLSIVRVNEASAVLAGKFAGIDVECRLFIFEDQQKSTEERYPASLAEAISAAREKLLLEGMSQETRR
jgi:hypothetical protein